MIHLSQTSTKGFNDVVFDQRNQAYGAYVLRREYPVNVLKSLLIGIAIIASILAIPYLAKLLYEKVVVNERVIPTDPRVFEIPPKDIKPPGEKPKQDNVKPPPPPPPGNTQGAGIIVMVDTLLEETKVNTDDSLTIGVANGKGDPFTGTTIGMGTNGGKGGGGKNDSIHNPFGLDRNPSFPGGEEALKRFLGDNLVYPEYAKSMGIEGKVHVTFVVNETGKVVNVKVPREIGGGLDEEAIRVIEMMPKWDPGVFEGRPVKVAYHLPIAFKLNF